MIIIQWFDSPNCLFNSDLFIFSLFYMWLWHCFEAKQTIVKYKIIFVSSFFFFLFFKIEEHRCITSFPPLLSTPFSQLYFFCTFTCQIGTVMELWRRRTPLPLNSLGSVAARRVERNRARVHLRQATGYVNNNWNNTAVLNTNGHRRNRLVKLRFRSVLMKGLGWLRWSSLWRCMISDIPWSVWLDMCSLCFFLSVVQDVI